jgi:hypothetical protein
MKRYDLMQVPVLGALLKNRVPQLVLTAVALGGFLFAILAGLTGTPVGSRNFAIIIVWIAWWAALILVAVPVLGRAWCTICPIPVPGEWLQRGNVLGPAGGGSGLNRRWPKRLRGMWLQNGAFLLLALFSTVVLTQPFVTALILLGLLTLAIATSLVFERRSFCRYLCPVGGFIGLYSQLAPVEVRVKDVTVCARCREKSCYHGNGHGYGCPWLLFPRALSKNTQCGLCLECLRTCHNSNVALNVRPFGDDLNVPDDRKLDEAYKAFIMLGSALVYATVLLGPWGDLKTVAYSIGSVAWIWYSVVFLLSILVLMPALFLAAVWLGQRLTEPDRPLRRAFVAQSHALIPLGLAAWIAFSLAFVGTNFSYVWPVLSDPMAWGWNLLGAAAYPWTPYMTGVMPALEVVVLLIGLAWSVKVAHRTAHAGASGLSLQALPVVAYCALFTFALLVLLVG